ncbi:hypothetical protein EW146_g10175 [Bondarzewia mesenterica]|uniref:Uncharacterized protein n=1 Tax=Bondarzewia mesenterica TaxID=1095465 RepID=A0A4S4L4G5_9AGAM|nr:hypothetical protein EW146_g10175 [Bondarzewia mesenterica]
MDPAVYAAKCSSPYLLFLSDNNLSPQKGHRIWKELDDTQRTHYKMLSEQVRAILNDAYPRLAVHHADKADIRELAKEACRNLGINVVQPDLWEEILETKFFQEDDPPAVCSSTVSLVAALLTLRLVKLQFKSYELSNFKNTQTTTIRVGHQKLPQKSSSIWGT